MKSNTRTSDQKTLITGEGAGNNFIALTADSHNLLLDVDKSDLDCDNICP